MQYCSVSQCSIVAFFRKEAAILCAIFRYNAYEHSVSQVLISLAGSASARFFVTWAYFLVGCSKVFAVHDRCSALSGILVSIPTNHIGRDISLKIKSPETLRGAQAIAPILVGILPFAVVFGFLMRQTGLTPFQSAFFALSLLAGASQIATVHLHAAGAPIFIIVATAVAINARYAMYSLSMEPLIRKETWWKRLFSAFIVSDQSYAFTMAEAESNPENTDITSFFLGAAIMLYLIWEIGILTGYTLGAVIPSGVPLDFAIPLVFMSLLIPHLKDTGRNLAALSAGVAAIFLAPLLPLQSGLLAALLVGIAAGFLFEQKRGGRTS